jgi:hypothetical protein
MLHHISELMEPSANEPTRMVRHRGRTALVDSAAMFGKKRVRFRPPGLKPTTKVGTLGPYRGRLGLAWVIAAVVAGLIIVVAGYLAVFR